MQVCSLIYQLENDIRCVCRRENTAFEIKLQQLFIAWVSDLGERYDTLSKANISK